ncbi:DNA dC-_dU-editing enzyme APOBEC-3-like isoform X1 [Peromyscus maniculatus bairdii]|uniref:DNA dC->dU-editing enzyme APOBEC-3-like isoform X1 n=2 Tax=Peromyscus maniculatus bairdii TaxID=230844 RepID=UPI00077DEA39|nr:DNA dC->dU-editing enzyme APOBEC-3-like isoform X1 [Peromyscus maniculatus bairdii]
MQSQRVGPRAGMGPTCPGCRRRRPYSPIRNPIKLLYQRTFYFHFKNLRFANSRNNTFLCYEVNGMECDELVPLYQGVFRKEDDIHAEECFLDWFHGQVLEVLSPSKEYKITWYVSWSPCGSCAEQVARFLATHRNLSLAIFSSRLYYFWDPHYQHKLHRLIQAGAQIAAMDFPEFKKCWNTFVDNGGKSFRPWKKLKINFRFQDSKLWEILRNPVNLLREDIFNLQFNNGARVEPVQHRFYKRTTYLCYQLEQNDDQEPLKGCLQNKKGKHAEILFIDEMRSLELGQARITCYLTWSPCPNCAQKLAAFKKDHPDLVLRVYTSRLYFHWRRKYQEGLCAMWQSGIQVDVMDLPQFTDCWTDFVNPQRPFQPWNQLEKNSRCIQRRLRRIKESWGLQGLLNDFGNLQLGPPLP